MPTKATKIHHPLTKRLTGVALPVSAMRLLVMKTYEMWMPFLKASLTVHLVKARAALPFQDLNQVKTLSLVYNYLGLYKFYSIWVVLNRKEIPLLHLMVNI